MKAQGGQHRKAVFEERRQEATALLKEKIDDCIISIIEQAQFNQEKVDDIIDKVKIRIGYHLMN